MKIKFQVAAMLSALIILAAVVLTHGSHKVIAASEGKISGTIKLDGTPPHQKPIDMSKEPSCAAQHTAKPVTTENVVVGSNGGLANVVIYISDGLSGAAASQISSQPAQINQKGCQYIPHVLAVDVNQDMKVVNSDQTSHNIHPLPTKNSQWNKSQPPNTPPFDAKFTNEEVAIPVKCNIHPWMHGYIAVVKGPYAVSNENGSYSIEGVPPGSYTITAWQEEYGTQTQKVTVAAGKPASADFTFKAK
jgi:plastocyanin